MINWKFFEQNCPKQEAEKQKYSKPTIGGRKKTIHLKVQITEREKDTVEFNKTKNY